MASTKQTLAALGDDEQTFTFKSLGETWHLSPADQVVIGEYEEWLEMDARERLERRRDKIGKNAYAVEGARIDAAATGGMYEWKGEYWLSVFRTTKGLLKLIHLMLTVRHTGLTLEETREIYDANHEEINRLFVRAMKLSDPFFSFLPDYSEDSAKMSQTTEGQPQPSGNGSISTNV